MRIRILPFKLMRIYAEPDPQHWLIGCVIPMNRNISKVRYLHLPFSWFVDFHKTRKNAQEKCDELKMQTYKNTSIPEGNKPYTQANISFINHSIYYALMTVYDGPRKHQWSTCKTKICNFFIFKIIRFFDRKNVL
jgi:hypothetical protein